MGRRRNRLSHVAECEREPISDAFIRAGGESISRYRMMDPNARQECAFALIAALDRCIATQDVRQTQLEHVIVEAQQLDAKRSIGTLFCRALGWRIAQLYTNRAIRVASSYLLWRKESPNLEPKEIGRVARHLAQQPEVGPHLPRSMTQLALVPHREYRRLVGAVLDFRLHRRRALVACTPEINGHRIIDGDRLAQLSAIERVRLERDLLERPGEWPRMPLTPGTLAAVDDSVEREFLGKFADRLVAAGKLPRLRAGG